jgi:hypothetical protein
LIPPGWGESCEHQVRRSCAAVMVAVGRRLSASARMREPVPGAVRMKGMRLWPAARDRPAPMSVADARSRRVVGRCAVRAYRAV